MKKDNGKVNKENNFLREEALNVLNPRAEKIVKRVSIIYDGKQYNVRIPKEFAKKILLDPKQDEFEFILEISKDPQDTPILYGQLIEKGENLKNE